MCDVCGEGARRLAGNKVGLIFILQPPPPPRPRSARRRHPHRAAAAHEASTAAAAATAMSDASPPLPFTARRKQPAANAVPPLTDFCLDALAANPEMIFDLRGTAEHLAIGLLYRIMRDGRLDYRLACVFRDAGHAAITEAVEALDLLSGMPTHNALGARGGGGCRW